MKKVEVTMEVTHRACRSFEVNDEEYAGIVRGVVPDQIIDELFNFIISHPDLCNEETDWAVVDKETGKTIIDWR